MIDELQPQQGARRGRRFVERFEARMHVHRLHSVRLGRVLLGIGLLAFGFVNILIPGPGGSVFVLGSALVLSGESRTLARLLDHGEVRFAAQVDWVLQRPIVAVVTIGTCVLAATTLVGVLVT
jgi:hypothetical protein